MRGNERIEHMRNGNGNEISMNDLIEAGVLSIDGVDTDGGILLEIDWDVLKEYDEDLYLRFREAEMMGEMIQ